MRSSLVLVAMLLLGCGGGSAGPAGHDGAQGPAGKDGAAGMIGPAGKDGQPGAAGKDSTADGSRLKARYLVASDGARTPVGWQDTQIGAPCSFGVAADGKTRCLPGAAPVLGSKLFYSDAACTMPALGARLPIAPCATVGDFAQIQIAGACGGATVLAVGPVQPDPTPGSVYYKDSSLGCTGIVATMIGTLSPFYGATIADPSMFVEATFQ